MKNLFTILFLLAFTSSLSGQGETEEKSDTLRKDALNIYFPEATSFLKENITYINYVRDRKVADMIIIKTTETNGSGGLVCSLFLEGQRSFLGMADTLIYSSKPDDTEEQIREKELNTLKLGLTRYVLKTPLSKYLSVNFSEPISSEVTSDKWNNWVFSTNLTGFGFGESRMSSIDLNGGVSASKITEEWKLDFSADYSYGKEKFILTDSLSSMTYTSTSRSKSSDLLLVKSINDHWSAGGTARLMSSSFRNYNLSISVMPGIEYDVFPYNESTRRQLRLLYSIGYIYNDYTEETEFGMMRETLFAHSFKAAYEVIQKWGNISLTASYRNYLRDFSENSLSVNGNISWSVAKGLRVNLGGNYSFIRDQISIPKGEATAEEIFLRRKELKTAFDYFLHFGLSYTFGSFYNNVVNPRFGGGQGGRMITIIN